MQIQQMTAEERTHKETIFKREVCNNYCKLCAVKHPEFCMFFFADLGRRYFTNIMFLIKVAHERKPKLIEALKSFEGFVALFCNIEVCQFRTNMCDIRQKLDCYQMFLTQSGEYFEEGEAIKLIVEWNEKLFQELCNELDDIAKITNSMSRKKRKRLFKIGTHITNIMDRWHNQGGGVGSSYKAKKVKKEVNTTLFYNDNEEWVAKIKSILEGDNELADSNRK